MNSGADSKAGAGSRANLKTEVGSEMYSEGSWTEAGSGVDSEGSRTGVVHEWTLRAPGLEWFMNGL